MPYFILMCTKYEFIEYKLTFFPILLIVCYYNLYFYMIGGAVFYFIAMERLIAPPTRSVELI